MEPANVAEMLQELLRRTHLSGPPDLATVVSEEARRIGADPVVLYVLDLEQSYLVPVPGAAAREVVPVRGTVAGRALTSTAVLDLEREGGGRRLWLPLLDGTDRLGVMEAVFPHRSERLPEPLVAACERYAHLTATLLAAKDLYGDHFKRLRRRRPMSVAGELLWDLVPPQVLAGDAFVLGAVLEPSYDMGGDAYDYALNDDAVLHFAVFDAMGHGLAAAGVAAFALAAYRNSRRRGADPASVYAEIDRAVFEQYPTTRFVTGLIARLDLDSGRLRWISAGHPPPLLIRSRQLVKTLEGKPAPPMGTRLAAGPPVVREEWLEAGDLVLLYTDGLTEARRPDGGLFTVERLGEFIERAASNGLPAPETLRRLRDAILADGEGDLRDDATAVLIEWQGHGQRALLPRTV